MQVDIHMCRGSARWILTLGRDTVPVSPAPKTGKETSGRPHLPSPEPPTGCHGPDFEHHWRHRLLWFLQTWPCVVPLVTQHGVREVCLYQLGSFILTAEQWPVWQWPKHPLSAAGHMCLLPGIVETVLLWIFLSVWISIGYKVYSGTLDHRVGDVWFDGYHDMALQKNACNNLNSHQ